MNEPNTPLAYDEQTLQFMKLLAEIAVENVMKEWEKGNSLKQAKPEQLPESSDCKP